ncbi:SDR family NAD(P)-dependent oxidoreductase [Actinoplanes sp. NPDC023801]|uniref:SDR family NAD(P)-dependent oxidoreductase n=1 Tax=Actinoplanes sp. NPDC023801 TaxID=3154595 RepID=UPI0033F9FF75
MSPSSFVDDADYLLSWIVERIAVLSGRAAGEVDPDETFAGNGLDSVRVAELAERLGSALGRRVDAAEMFECPTPRALARSLTASRVAEPAAPGPADAGAPIAVVGLACRMPGAPDARAFWRMLLDGVDAVGDAPPGRGPWPTRGGFLPEVADFDASFFRISTEEAEQMDPQQRMLLETTVEALEDAAELPARLRGSATGVFVGISSVDHAHRVLGPHPGRFTPTGNSSAIAANRLSYAFDWRGPSLAVDTACSSSLVAVHLAVRALRAGDCERAVAGGVNVLLDPRVSAGLSEAGMLAPDGRCKAFGAAADGYGRGEGCGVVVLKRLSDALAAGDRVYAVIRGTAVTSDGASNGLTAPNPAAQRAVLAAAYADAGLTPAAAGYIECHGTGTPLGDPIEARSIAEARGTGDVCVIGSVKSNIGHLEAAAGIAGLIKTVLAVHHATIPPSLHAAEPSTAIPFGELRLRVATGTEPWPGDQRYAGVSGFGFGGTNAHVVLGAAPPAAQPAALTGPVVVPLSARSRDGLDRLAGALAEHLRHAGPDQAGAVAATMALGRTAHRPYRATLVAADPRDLPARAAELARDLPAATVPATPPAPPAVGFVFSGQGSQFAGMGRELYRADPLFRSTVRRCDEAVAGRIGFRIEDVLSGASEVDVDDTAVAQVLIVAVQLGLARLWESLGVRPAAVAGHSVGELAAAAVAGILDPAEAISLAAVRGRTMAAAPAGAMAATGLTESEAARRYPHLDVAAVNAPGTTVLAGPAADIDRLADELSAAFVPVSRLPVRYAFHSRLMDAAAAELAEAAGPLRPGPGDIPFYSTVTGARGIGEKLDGGYWSRGVRQPVRFADAVSAMVADGVTVLLEIGPRAALQGSLGRIAEGAGVSVLSTVAGPEEQVLSAMRTAGELYRLGVPVDWRHLYPGPRRVTSAPSHAWDRRRHWSPLPDTAPAPAPADLLGRRVDLADTDRLVWQSELRPGSPPWLREHRVSGAAILPAAGFLDVFTAAARALPGSVAVADVTIESPLPVDGAGVRLQCTVTGSGDEREAVVHARDGDGPWRRHARARLVAAAAPPGRTDTGAVARRCPDTVPGPPLYAALSARGLEYGPLFRAVTAVRAGDREALAELAVPDTDEPSYRVRLLDAALHALAATGAAGGAGAGAIVPIGAQSLTWWRPERTARRAHLLVRDTGRDVLIADLTLLDGEGEAVAGLRGLRLRRLGREHAGDRLHCYDLRWREQPAHPAGPEPAGRMLVLAPVTGPGAELADRLAAAGATVCRTGPGPARLDERPHIDPLDGEQHRQLLRHFGASLGAVVHLPGAGGEDAADAVESALHLVRAATFAAIQPRLLFVTAGAQPVAGHPVTDPLGAAVWGLIKTVPVEHPRLAVGCLDLDPADDDPVAAIHAELRTAGRDAEAGYRGGVRFVRRASRTAIAPPAAVPVRPDSAYVITGGSGALGRQVAERLAERGAGRIVLIARRAPREPLPPGLLRHCPDVEVIEADVADPAQLRRALTLARAGDSPLRGVVHAAGVLDNAALLEMVPDAVRAVLAPKVRGGWLLHELTADDPLDWFVLFSSAAGVLGSPGQANYAAANACLDALAHHRRGMSRPAVSIDWGPWGQAGMGADWGSGLDHELRTAARVIAPPDGLDAFEAFAAGTAVQPLVLPFDIADLTAFYPSDVGRDFFAEVATAQGEALRTVGTPRSARPDLAVPYTAPRTDVEERIAAIVQKSTGIAEIGVHDPFFEVGGDSVMANQILVEVNRVLGVRLRPEDAFAELTVANLAALAEADMLARLDDLTEEEAALLLAQPEEEKP